MTAGCAALLGVGLTACEPSLPWRSELVSRDARNPVFSPDGTKMAFVSLADTAPGDTNGRQDIYLRDLATGDTALLSVDATGTNGGNHDSYHPVFSPDGSRVAFESYATDLGPNDTNGFLDDVYVRDLANATTTLVSVDATGTGSGNAPSGGPVFTPDGRGVAFTSSASDLVAHDTNGPEYDIFVRDLTGQTTTLLSTNASGTGSGDGASWGPTFSSDGTTVAFTSSAGDLGPVDTNAVDDVYVRDLTTGATTLASVTGSGTDGGNARSFWPVIGGDGSWVVFESEASDLGPTDTNAARDVYRRDLATGTTTLVSVDATGGDSGNRQAVEPVVSPTGDQVAFATPASDLGPTDPGDDWDVYMRDVATGTTTLVSVNARGTDGGNRYSGSPTFSPDGSRLTFESDANDLGPTDTNTCRVKPVQPPDTPCLDVYVRDLAAARTALASVDDAGSDSRPMTVSSDVVFNPADSGQIAYHGWLLGTPGDIYRSTLTR